MKCMRILPTTGLAGGGKRIMTKVTVVVTTPITPSKLYVLLQNSRSYV